MLVQAEQDLSAEKTKANNNLIEMQKLSKINAEAEKGIKFRDTIIANQKAVRSSATEYCR